MAYKPSDLGLWAVIILGGLALVGLSAWLGLPLLQDAAASLQPGLGIKDAALGAFITTVVLFVLFALVAGDGVIGELPVMLLGFFAFFVIITLLIAWIF